uniref:Exported protein n=1 Tax=Strongyloides venezuelensis TaxID=75913 RepID=A0A0K0G5E7_STRVS
MFKIFYVSFLTIGVLGGSILLFLVLFFLSKKKERSDNMNRKSLVKIEKENYNVWIIEPEKKENSKSKNTVVNEKSSVTLKSVKIDKSRISNDKDGKKFDNNKIKK